MSLTVNTYKCLYLTIEDDIDGITQEWYQMLSKGCTIKLLSFKVYFKNIPVNDNPKGLVSTNSLQQKSVKYDEVILKSNDDVDWVQSEINKLLSKGCDLRLTILTEYPDSQLSDLNNIIYENISHTELRSEDETDRVGYISLPEFNVEDVADGVA